MQHDLERAVHTSAELDATIPRFEDAFEATMRYRQTKAIDDLIAAQQTRLDAAAYTNLDADCFLLRLRLPHRLLSVTKAGTYVDLGSIMDVEPRYRNRTIPGRRLEMSATPPFDDHILFDTIDPHTFDGPETRLYIGIGLKHLVEHRVTVAPIDGLGRVAAKLVSPAYMLPRTYHRTQQSEA